jgi:ornithine cyclodeaminase/alanine dehydrogenase-like protein (mu-crystallin family)
MSSPLLQLTAADVHAALPWEALAAALTTAFVAPPVAPLRTSHTLHCTPEQSDTLLLMPAWDAQHIGVKLVTVIADAPAHGGRTVEASYLLLDRRTGAPRALIDGEALTVRRTAATSALAARHLARADAGSLLVIGTGRLAPWMVRAYVALLPALHTVRLWGRDGARSAALADALRDEGYGAPGALRLETVPPHGLEQGVRASDVVTAVTTARTPVVHGAWLRAGTHVDLVGGFTPDMREADDATITRASVVVVDRYEGALHEAGDLVQPLAAGVITRDRIRAELGELLRGERAGRQSPAEITLFKSVGHALEDLAAACLAARHRVR